MLVLTNAILLVGEIFAIVVAVATLRLIYAVLTIKAEKLILLAGGALQRIK